MSDPQKRDDAPLRATGNSSMETLTMEKERFKESQYMSLYKGLLRKHRGVLQEHPDEDLSDFTDEATLLKEAISSQRQIWIAGIGIGILTFVSLHYVPTFLIRRLGGEAKLKALAEAELQAKADGTAFLRRVTGLLVESSFSFWAGYRAYHLAAAHSEDTYELLAQVPLCAGRSAVAERLCNDWIDITNTQIPLAFWQNLGQGNLREERAWQAIRQFSEHCVWRQRYEARLREKAGISNPNEPVVLPRKVPYYTDVYVNELTSEEAQKLVTDRK